MSIKDRVVIAEESRKRVSKMKFGDPVTNVCAGEGNPHRHAFFVEFKIKSSKNRWGITHKEYLAKCTDRKGTFWDTDIDAIYRGHLDTETCHKLYAPIHEAEFGSGA